jgi:hypothetical protein
MSPAIDVVHVEKFVKSDPQLDGSALDRISTIHDWYVISTQPAAVNEGDFSKMKYGIGPILIYKETGEVFRLSSSREHSYLRGLIDDHKLSIKFFRNEALRLKVSRPENMSNLAR